MPAGMPGGMPGMGKQKFQRYILRSVFLSMKGAFFALVSLIRNIRFAKRYLAMTSLIN